MDNNLTQEQITNIKKELERIGIPCENGFLNPVNPKDHISFMFFTSKYDLIQRYFRDKMSCRIAWHEF